jgi:uncharacterized protein (DUF433 family)
MCTCIMNPVKATTFLSVRMPESESHRVKVLAARLKLSLQEVVRQALDAWVQEHDPQARRRRERHERQAGALAPADARAPRRLAKEQTPSMRAPELPGARVAAGRASAQQPGVRSAPQVTTLGADPTLQMPPAAGRGSAEPPSPVRAATPRNLNWLKEAEHLDWSKCRAVKVRVTQAGRVWFFRGTQIPVAAVLHDFIKGRSLGEVLARHAGLTAEQARAAVEFAYRSLAHTNKV